MGLKKQTKFGYGVACQGFGGEQWGHGVCYRNYRRDCVRADVVQCQLELQLAELHKRIQFLKAENAALKVENDKLKQGAGVCSIATHGHLLW